MTGKGNNFITLSCNYLPDNIYSSECAQFSLWTARIESVYEEHCCIFSLGYILSQEWSLGYCVAIWPLLITALIWQTYDYEKNCTLWMRFIYFQMDHSGWYNTTSILYNHVVMHNERRVLRGILPMIGRRNNFLTIPYNFLHVDMFI